MPDLTELIGAHPQGQNIQVWRGLVAVAPMNDNAWLQVIIPGRADLEIFEVPAGNWMARGASLPQAGTLCVVLIDEQGDTYVPMWDGVTTVVTEGAFAFFNG